MAIVDEAHDAFGRALVDHFHDRPGPELILEVDDGSARRADMQPHDFFDGFEAWPSWERAAITRAIGAVLDLGAGAGRHGVHLLHLGHAVTAVDASPGYGGVCRAGGLIDVRHVDINDHALEGRWDTILLMGGNLGLGGDGVLPALLSRLAGLAPVDGLLIGDSVDPASTEPDDLAYEERNRLAGFHRGHVVAAPSIRRARLPPWWHQLNIPPEDLRALIDGTGWIIDEQMGDADGYAVVLRRR